LSPTPGGLLSRGLLAEQATKYGALPPTKRERSSLAGILSNYVRNHFPDYAKLYSGAGVIGVPGFWQDCSTVVHIWNPRNYLMPILVIPYKDAKGLIQACQIRLHARDISIGGKKYRWLASPLERRGASSRTPIHFTFAPEKLPAGETVVIVRQILARRTLTEVEQLLLTSWNTQSTSA